MKRLAVPLIVVATLGVLLAISVLGGGTSSTRPATEERAALARSVQQSMGDFYRPYTTLRETLPNARGHDGSVVNDLVVVGTVSGAKEEAGYRESGRAPTAGKPGAEVVGYNDPKADWRTITVTIAVQETLGGKASDEVVINWPLMGNSSTGASKHSTVRALKALGRVVVLSRANPSGPEFLGITRSVLDREYGVLVVGDDGALTFPFSSAGAARDHRFAAGVDTLAELRAAAAQPSWTKPGTSG